MYPSIQQQLFAATPSGGKFLDVGCFGFAQRAAAHAAGRADIAQYGVDYAPSAPTAVPEGFTFAEADLNRDPIPFGDDMFDVVVASHVIEHVSDPIRLLAECVRVCRPGGLVYVECPSERSLMLPGVPFAYEQFCSFSFYDDPTHQSRPWTPQGLYRLARYFGCDVRAAGRVTSWTHRLAFPLLLPWYWLTRNVVAMEQLLWMVVGWSSYALIQKPQTSSGAPVFRYYIPDRGRSAERLR
jgi:SAM-dependent methyltransferase